MSFSNLLKFQPYERAFWAFDVSLGDKSGSSATRIFFTARNTLCFVAFVFSPSARLISSIERPSKWRSTNAARSMRLRDYIAEATRSCTSALNIKRSGEAPRVCR